MDGLLKPVEDARTRAHEAFDAAVQGHVNADDQEHYLRFEGTLRSAAGAYRTSVLTALAQFKEAPLKSSLDRQWDDLVKQSNPYLRTYGE